MTLRNRGGECNPYQQQSRIDLENEPTPVPTLPQAGAACSA